MGRPEDEIKEKLVELEASIDEVAHPPARQPSSTGLSAGKSTGRSADDDSSGELYTFGGYGLILLGLLIVLNHVKVTSNFMWGLSWGSVGFGLSIVPLMIGLGMMFVNPKNKLAWVITIASLAFILFAVLSQLSLSFPAMSMLGLVLMFLPFAGGGALIAKGLQAKRGTDN